MIAFPNEICGNMTAVLMGPGRYLQTFTHKENLKPFLLSPPALGKDGLKHSHLCVTCMHKALIFTNPTIYGFPKDNLCVQAS